MFSILPKGLLVLFKIQYFQLPFKVKNSDFYTFHLLVFFVWNIQNKHVWIPYSGEIISLVKSALTKIIIRRISLLNEWYNKQFYEHEFGFVNKKKNYGFFRSGRAPSTCFLAFNSGIQQWLDRIYGKTELLDWIWYFWINFKLRQYPKSLKMQ